MQGIRLGTMIIVVLTVVVLFMFVSMNYCRFALFMNTSIVLTFRTSNAFERRGLSSTSVVIIFSISVKGSIFIVKSCTSLRPSETTRENISIMVNPVTLSGRRAFIFGSISYCP